MANRAQAKKLHNGRQARVRRSGLGQGMAGLMFVLIIISILVTPVYGANASAGQDKNASQVQANGGDKELHKGEIHVFKYVNNAGMEAEVTSYIIYGVIDNEKPSSPIYLHFTKNGEPTSQTKKAAASIVKMLAFVGVKDCDLLAVTGENDSCGPGCIKKLREKYFKPDVAEKLCNVPIKFDVDFQNKSARIAMPSNMSDLSAYERNLNTQLTSYLEALRTTSTTVTSTASTATSVSATASTIASPPTISLTATTIPIRNVTSTTIPKRWLGEVSAWLSPVAILLGLIVAILFLLVLSRMTSAINNLSLAPQVRTKPNVKAKVASLKRSYDATDKPIRHIATAKEDPPVMVGTWAERESVEPPPDAGPVNQQTSDGGIPGAPPVIDNDSIHQEIAGMQSTVDEIKQDAQHKYDELFAQLSGLVDNSTVNSENIEQLKRDIGDWKSSMEQVQTEQARQAEELASQRQLVTGMQEDNRSLTQKASDYEAQLKQVTAALASIMSRSGLHAAEALMRDPATEAEPTRRAELESQRLAAAADISRAELVLSERAKQFQEMLRDLNLAIQKAQGMVNRLMPTLQAQGQMLALSDLLNGLEILANYQDPVMLVDSLRGREMTVYRDLHDPAEAEKRTLADLLTSEEIWKTLTLVLRAPAMAKVNLWQYSNDISVFYLISQLGVARHMLVDFLAQCGVEPQSINFMETYTTDLACEVAGAAVSPQYERHPEVLQEMLTNWEKAFKPQSVIYDVEVWGFSREVGASRKSLVYYLDDQRVRLMVNHMGDDV